MPHKNEFYSSESGKGVSEKECQQVLKVWNKSEMKTKKDYHNLYLKRDVLLLADAFEKSRNRCLEDCGLCTRHYLRAPGLKAGSYFRH